METKERKNGPEAGRAPRREAPPRKRPPAKQEPARKRPAGKTQQTPPAKRRKPPVTKGKDRDKREAAARAAKLKAMKRSVDAKNAAPKAQDRRKVRKPHRPMQPIVYTQPRVFNRNKLLLQLGTILAVVLAMILGLSIFFRVKTIEVSGAEIYSPWTIRESSGIQEGDYLLLFSKAKAAARIRAENPYVERIRFGIKLPDTVIIDIEELEVVYAVAAQNGTTWLITSEGRVVEQCEAAAADNYTWVRGVTLSTPTKGDQAYPYEAPPEPVATQPEDETTDPSGVPTAPPPVTVTARDQLNAALKILRALEAHDIIGQAAEVDVSNINDIRLVYGTKYQVKLGDMNNMDHKIASMLAAIEDPRMKNSMGILDVSFTTWPDMVGYTPYES